MKQYDLDVQPQKAEELLSETPPGISARLRDLLGRAETVARERDERLGRITDEKLRKSAERSG